MLSVVERSPGRGRVTPSRRSWRPASPSLSWRSFAPAKGVRLALGVALVSGCGSTSQISLLGTSGGSARAGAGGSPGGPDATTAVVDSGTGGTRLTTGTRPDAAAPRDGGGACRTSADCRGATPRCDVASGSCVGCLVDSNCPSYLCDPVLHACAGCTRNADCHATTPYCDDDDRRCVQCTSAAQCAVGEVCVAEAHACAARCVNAADCVGGNRPFCAAAAGVCVECLTSADCTTGGHPEFCDPKVGSCVQCLVDADCGHGRCTPLERRCVGCLTSGDCSDGKRCVASECAP